MVVASAKLVGAASATGWAQVHTFFPEEEKSRLGALLAVVTLFSDKETLDLASFGGEVIQRVHESYYGAEGGAGLERLTKVLETIDREFGGTVIVSVVLAVVVQIEGESAPLFYAGILGPGRIVLSRQDKVVNLLQGEETITSVSGRVQPGDVIVLGSKRFFSLVDDSDLEAALKLGVPTEVVDELAPAVHAHESGLAAAVVMRLEEEAVEKKTAEDIQTIAQKVTVEDRQETRSPILTAPTSVRKAVSSALGGWWRVLRDVSRRVRPARIYVKEDPHDKRRRLIGTVALLLFILLVISLGFGWWQQRTSLAHASFTEVKTNVERTLSQSDELTELNPLRSRALLVEAEKVVTEYEQSEKLPRAARSWLETIHTLLDERRESLLKVYEVASAGTFLDLGLVREGSRGNMMDFDGERLLILDNQNQLTLTVGVDDKKAGVVGGGDLLRGATVAAIYFRQGFVLSDRGIVELDLDRRTSAIVIEPESAWGEIGALDVFGGNLYLLDKGEGSIYRYRAAEGGFGSRQAWLGQGVEPDFTNVVSMAIDGNIWILTSTGKIEEYSQGTGAVFEPVGLDTPLKEPRSLYTDEETEKIYVLDSGEARVVVFDKEGLYLAQYRWPGMREATDLVVVEKLQKLLLLSGSVIYEVPLQ